MNYRIGDAITQTARGVDHSYTLAASLADVLAHQVAKAQAVAAFGDKDGKPDSYWASLVTWPASGITTVAGIRGHSFAFSDPASTSGHLFPTYLETIYS